MENEISIQPIVHSTAQGISSLIEYGVLGIVASIALGFSVIVAWVLIKQAKSCFEGTKEVVANNTRVMHGVEIAITRIEAKLDAQRG